MKQESVETKFFGHYFRRRRSAAAEFFAFCRPDRVWWDFRNPKMIQGSADFVLLERKIYEYLYSIQKISIDESLMETIYSLKKDFKLMFIYFL